MRWTIDPSHTSLEFAVRHLGIATVRGTFHRVSGTIEGDPADPTSVRGEVIVDLASVDTRDERRDAHLRSSDFFDVERYPTARFVVTAVEPRGGGRYTVRGDLTLRDVTQPIELSAESGEVITDPWGNRRSAVHVEGTIDRTAFGLTWNQVLEAGRLLVGETVRITADAELVAEAQSTAA